MLLILIVRGEKGGEFAFNYLVVELFERKIRPKYSEGSSLDIKKAITWKTAHEDIEQQRSKGLRGPMFLITCHLYNKNKGKKNWNEDYGGFDFTGKVPTTTVARKVDLKPEWAYRITGVRRISDKRLQHIKRNYQHIYKRIVQEKRVRIEWFFE